MATSLIGPVAGAVSTVPEGGSPTPPNTGDGAEFALGNLTFRLAISDERPYERATAQFRKEQFDTSPVYGDQSLTGMWTRGQFSFHKGAGVRYYETLDGDTVLNRFREGEGVDPFTPGEVTLAPQWAEIAPLVNPKWAGAADGFWAALDGTDLKYATDLTGTVTTHVPEAGAGTALSAAVGAKCAYITTSNVGHALERVGIALGAPSTEEIYTHTNALSQVFYAKDRIWALDGVENAWYQLSPNPSGALPVAVASTDLVFTAGDSWGVDWALADTAGAVLLGNGPRIYAVTIDADGAVPTLAAPVQVAELPNDERVVNMTAHLGFVVIVTNRGVRVAVTPDSGAVTYGPLIIEFATRDGNQSTTVARRGSIVYVADAPTTDCSLYAIDLAHQVGDSLEFAWVKHSNPFTAADFSAGTFMFEGTLMAWQNAGGLYGQTTEKTETGSLTTGFHRFGTLEPKKFHSVRVRVGGLGGTVTVAKVLTDGSEVSLLTMDVSDTDGEIITLRTPAPVEAVGLKFTLTRDSIPEVGPTLLGYQLKAMPAPQRHRMIRVPLKLYDVERSKATPAQGYDGSAWHRLEALENMERSGASYVFQDFRTGEAGECFIEQIEHRGTTATGPNNSGFGGVVWVTLRKL